MNEESKERKEKSATVQLGCGTLILIALIVAFCSGAGEIDDIDAKLDTLQEEVAGLRHAVERLAGEEAETEAEPEATPGPEEAAPAPAEPVAPPE